MLTRGSWRTEWCGHRPYTRCMVRCMRTNIELDDDLIAEAGRYTTVRSKREIVREALATYVAVKSEERRRATYRERLQRIRAQAAATPVRSDVHDLVRKDREAR